MDTDTAYIISALSYEYVMNKKQMLKYHFKAEKVHDV